MPGETLPNSGTHDADLLESLRTAYEENPADVAAAALLAEHYMDLGWYNEALDVYRDALSRGGDDFPLLLGSGMVCFRRRDLAGALDAFLKLTKMRPDRIEGWNNAGIAAMALGRLEEAKTCFSRVLEIEPDNSGALLNLANYLAGTGDTAGAVRLLERAIAAQPDFADAHFNLGNAYCAQKDFAKAKSSFERALRIQREFPSALKNLGFVHERLGEYEQAIAAYRRAADLDKTDAGVRINLANACLAVDNIEEAKSSFLRAVRLAPKNTAGWLGLRHIAFLKGDMPTYVRATLAIVPHLKSEAIARSVEALLDLGRGEEARQIMDAADRCGKQGDELDAQRMLDGGGSGTAGEKGRILYQRLCTIGAPSDAIRKALGRYAFSAGDLQAAEEHLGKLEGFDPAAKDLLIRTLLARGDKERARGLLLECVSARPENGSFLLLLAGIAIDEGKEDDAKRYLVQAIEYGLTDLDEINRNPRLAGLYASLAPDGRPPAA